MTKKKFGIGLLFMLALCMCLKAAPANAAPAWMKKAEEINLVDDISGTVAPTDENSSNYEKYYEIYVPAKTKLTLEGSIDDEHTLDVRVYNSKENRKDKFSENDWVYDPGDNISYFKESVTLSAGTYYIKVIKDSDDDDIYYASDSMNWYISLNAKFVNKPAIKKLKRKGRTTAKITLKNYSGNDGFLIYVKKGKKGKYKLIKNTWKTSFSYKKLSRKKKYYFRVRAYYKTDGNIIYSPYSKAKLFKTR